jgi:hypothetical protein
MAVNQASITKAAMAGVGLSILFGIVNGLSTWIMKDGQTIEQWATSTVGGV